MKLSERLYNAKGFMHSSNTPQEDKDFYAKSKIKASELQKIGEAFLNENRIEYYRNLEPSRIELGVQSRYMHRGVYCPSPIYEVVVTNAKRGKILKRPSAKSIITHRYVYDSNDMLSYIHEYIDESPVASEYLIYRGNVIYGVTIDIRGFLQKVSEEIWEKGRLKSFTVICFSWEYGLDQYKYYTVEHEKYRYNDDGLCGCDWYDINYFGEWQGHSGIIRHDEYEFIKEDGCLKMLKQTR